MNDGGEEYMVCAPREGDGGETGFHGRERRMGGEVAAELKVYRGPPTPSSRSSGSSMVFGGGREGGNRAQARGRESRGGPAGKKEVGWGEGGGRGWGGGGGGRGGRRRRRGGGSEERNGAARAVGWVGGRVVRGSGEGGGGCRGGW